MEVESVLYCVSFGNFPICKVGITNDRTRRLSELQTGSPVTLKIRFEMLLQDLIFAQELEQHILFNLRPHRLEGEWFALPPQQIIATINDTLRYYSSSGIVGKYDYTDLNSPTSESCKKFTDAIRIKFQT